MTLRNTSEDQVSLKLEIILSQLQETTAALQELLEERKGGDDVGSH